MTYVMATVPRKYLKAGRDWLKYFEATDCHKWVVALEHGKGGLEHWQVRFKVRACETKQQKEAYFNEWKRRFPEGHIEFTENWCDYERKEGNFVSSDDTRAILSIRYGTLRPIQRNILDTIRTQSDREIDVWYDPQGNHGKSWLSLYLYEKGIGLLVPRYCCTAREMSGFVCSSYAGQSIVVIDIPRAGKINKDLYETMEEIKDGIVHDPRYSGKTRNIRGVKLLVFTNQKLDSKQLSADRWRLHGFGQNPKRRVPGRKNVTEQGDALP